MNRNECVICSRADNFIEIHQLKNYPITPASTLESSDEFRDCVFVTCTNRPIQLIMTILTTLMTMENSNNMSLIQIWTLHSSESA